MIDSSHRGQEQDRIESESRAVATFCQYGNSKVGHVVTLPKSTSSARSSFDTSNDSSMLVRLTEDGLELRFGGYMGRQVVDVLWKDDILRAQVIAAVLRISDEYSVSHRSRYDLQIQKEGNTTEIVVDSNGYPDYDLDVPTILKKLCVPEAPVFRDFTSTEVMDLMVDAFQVDNRFNDVNHSSEGNAALYCEHHAKGPTNLSVMTNADMSIEYHGIELSDMTVSALGNFLYAVKHHGEEVALAVMHRIFCGEYER